MKPSQTLGLSAALAAIGICLLCAGPVAGPHARTTATAASNPQAARTPPPVSPSTTVLHTTSASAVTAANGEFPSTNALAPDDGPGGDHLVQALLDAHSLHNLSPWVEQNLDQLGRAVWLADLTGRGRTQWPRYFTASGTSGYSSIRIQAAAAHATGPGRAAVTLIWAGTFQARDPEVGMPGTVLLAQQSGGTWEPIR